MDTKELRTFVALAETLNYQKAAELLAYAPSTLSKQIRSLEDEFGIPLFKKVRR